MNPRIFTMEEANAMLPQLDGALIRLQEKKKQIDLLQVEIDLMEIVSAPPAAHPGDGYAAGGQPSKPAGERLDQLNGMVQEYTKAFEEIESWGPVVKDVDQGLVDFYYVRDQQLVFLCWRQGEPGVGYWHDLESGFPGRKPL